MNKEAGIDTPVLSTNRSLLILVLLIIDSLHFVFARLLLPHISPKVSAFYVIAVGTVEVAVYGLIRRQVHLKTLKDNLWFFLSIGFLIGVSTIINYEAIAYIDPGTASLLAKASMLMSLGFGIFWLGERLSVAQTVGALTAIAGVLIITFQPGDYVRLGSLLILLSAFMYALHTAIVKRFSGQMEFVDFFFFRLFSTSGLLFLISWGRGALVWPSSEAWVILIIAGTVDVVISRSIFYLALRWMKMSVHTIVLTLSPVVAVLWTIFLFDTVPTVQQLIGGAGVILGVMIVTVRQRI